MFGILQISFGRPPKPPHPDLSVDPETLRRIVAAHSHGNAHLEAGRFYTADDVDAEYDLIRGARFAA